MPNDFSFIGILTIFSALLPIAGLGMAWLLRPKKPNPTKSTTYECGMETIGETWVQFKAQYYIYALIFVVFDIEAVFLFPWALALTQLPLISLIPAFLFIIFLLDALVYAWLKGALKWS